uniref:Dicarboxylic amino acid permease n=1 Tax=Talaromyces marneffei PM1 TaxID=1077442 RepID=A0A093UQG6_TALMA
MAEFDDVKDAIHTDTSAVPSRHVDNEDGWFVDKHEREDLVRGLKQRHVQMIAIAGAIGTGLFLGLGKSISTAGPLGALLGYMLVGAIVCAVQFALGEVTALFPVTGSFVRHSEILVDPALCFAIGWNVVYGNFLSVPSEISAAVVLIQYWNDNINPAVWVTIFIVLSTLVAVIFIGVYGEVEFFFAVLKILLVIGIVIMGLVIDLGGVPGKPRLGFQYWNAPGPFVEYIAEGSWGQFLGFWAVMSNAVYSFAGVESLAMAAAETKNPRHNIPKACKRVFARITIFYVLAILIVGMLVSSDDERLSNDSGTAAQSPFVIAASDAGIKAIPSIVNAVVLTSAWSSSNQAILAGTRTLYGLAVKGHAPKFFLWTTPYGIPYMCVAAQIAFSFLGYICWCFGLLDYHLVEPHTPDSSPENTGLSPPCLTMAQLMDTSQLTLFLAYGSWFALVSCVIILLTGGFTVFTSGNWDPSSFVSSYLDIPLVLVAFGVYKFLRRTKYVSLRDIPIAQALEEARNDPENVPIVKGARLQSTSI